MLRLCAFLPVLPSFALVTEKNNYTSPFGFDYAINTNNSSYTNFKIPLNPKHALNRMVTGNTATE